MRGLISIRYNIPGSTPIFTFDAGVPKEINADYTSNISTSTRHHRARSHSLKWEFVNGSFLQLNEDIGYQATKKEHTNHDLSTFSIWIYNETPYNGHLTFEFGRSEKIDCHFNFYLNFTGWRTAWVAYTRDMAGIPKPDMDRLTIRASKEVKEGTLYFDQIILLTPIDPRYHMRDAQVPFVNIQSDQRANRHWMSLYRFQQIRPKELLTNMITASDDAELSLILERYEEGILSPKEITSQQVDKIISNFQVYGISRKKGNMTGPQVTYIHYQDIYPEEQRAYLNASNINVKAYTMFMHEVAVAYRSTTDRMLRQQLSAVFIDLVEHLHDQGWASGSGLGTLHHLGYSLTDYYTSLFLMRKELKRCGMLNEVSQAMYWFSGAGRIFVDPSEGGGGVIDIFNTTLGGMLASVLMMENKQDQINHLNQLSLWIDHFLRPAPGLTSCIKVDGSAFHHAGHYPAYAAGGLIGVAPIIYCLSRTSFHISEVAHKSMNHALLMMRLYSNKYQWPLSLSGRHPTGIGRLSIEPYKYMALSGSPTGKKVVDQEMARVYLRLSSQKDTDTTVKLFSDLGIVAEPDPNGHWTMNYAALSLHRRDQWLIAARGHSRYLWANETYSKANLYGRYITYGHVQILASGNPVNNYDSGFRHDGWNWNRWPGTTVIHLPLDELCSDVRNVDDYSGVEEMLISDETYAAGLNIGGENGMFAMKLHEHPKYNGSHRARKSVFFFDDRIILLGSNIENNQTNNPTETTLFQNHFNKQDEPVWISGEQAVTNFPYEYKRNLDESVWLIDNKGHGYYIPQGQKLNITLCEQQSKSQDKGRDTSGTFVTAWIDHGYKPSEEQYEYAIQINTTPEKMQQFSNMMEEEENAVYKVLKKDKQAHIVLDMSTQITGYALFEENIQLKEGNVLANNRPCMVMTHLTEDLLRLSIVDPDLRLYNGIDASQYDKNGERMEVSMYSRDWLANESQVSMIQITLNGQWHLSSEAKDCKMISLIENKTILEFRLQDAVPVEVSLRKEEDS